MAYKIRFIFTVIAAAFLSIIAYVFLHESGHALVALLCGAENVGISILQARSWWTGGNFTPVTASLRQAAGAALPVCVSWAAILFYAKGLKSMLYHIIYPFFTVIATGGVLAWVFLPLWSIFAPLPDQADDVAKFLNTSNLPPLPVSLTAVIVILIGIFLAKKKGVFHGLFQIIKEAQNA